MKTIFKLKKWLLLGILLRLLIMPFTGHWDLTSLNQVADSLWHSGQSAAYSFYYAIYPPFTYLFLGLWQKLISPLVFSDFHSFLNDPVGVVFLNPHVFRYLFLLKLSYVFFDLGIGFLLYSLVEDKKKKEKIFKLWMLNPITLYATFAWGTIDLIPTFLVILALFLAKKQKGYWAVLALGLGVSFKAFPFLFLIPFCLTYFSSFKKRLKGIFLGLLPFAATILPFLSDKNFVLQFFSSEQLQVIQHAGFYIGREENISLYYIFYSLLIFFLWSRYGVKYNFNWLFFLVIFVFYALASFTPQWFIWGVPLLFLVMVENDISLFWYVLILAIYLFLVLMFEVTLNLGLLAPLEVTFLDYPSWGEKINSILSVTRIDGLLRSVFSAIIFWLVYLSKPKQRYENS
ncbi:hypothetical protein HZA75_06610 [Candidatus Roizmanbacteria bacterium]|nr:hypothetical protein [Candidatus Roizmanbacteria bacterium]